MIDIADIDLEGLDLIQVQAELAKRSLKDFIKIFWSVIEPGVPFRDSWYIDCLCEHLENIDEYRRLLINIPPRHTKSLLVNVFLPAWRWAKDPSDKFLCVTYSMKLSTRDSLRCRRLVESPLYQACFPDLKLQFDANKKDRYETTASGYRISASIESNVTGDGGNIIFDEPNLIEESQYQVHRQKVIEFWRTVLSTRLNDYANDFRLVCQQRSHQNDLSGYILEHEADHWKVVCLPFEYGRGPAWSFPDDPRTEEGEPLSDRLPDEEIAWLKKALGSTAFASQWNQVPRPKEGNLFKAEWLRRYKATHDSYVLDNRMVPKRACWRIITADLATTENTSADYTVIQVWAVTPDSELILEHQYRERVAFTRMLPILTSLYNDYHASYIGMEATGFQKAVVQMARQSGLPIRTVNPKMDKIANSFPLQVRMEGGQVWFPYTADRSFMEELEEEFILFPNAKHDDQVDASSIACLLVSRHTRERLQALEQPSNEKTPEQRYHEMLWAETD